MADQQPRIILSVHKIEVVIESHDCVGIPVINSEKNSDSYVECSLVSNGKEILKEKFATQTTKCLPNTAYEFMFDGPSLGKHLVKRKTLLVMQ